MAEATTISLAANNPLNQLRKEYGFGRVRAGMWVISILLFILIGWSFFAKLDEVAIAIGEVVPQDQLKVVQHLEGGVVEEILVREGDPVQAGDLLVRLKLGASAVNMSEIEAAIDGFQLTRMRLEAEAGRREPEFDPEMVARRSDLAESELAIYEARLDELARRTAVTKERIRQRRLEYDELIAHRDALQRDFGLGKERLQMSSELVEEGLTPRMEHVSLQAEISKMEGELDVMKASLPRASAAIKEAEAELAEEREAYTRRAIEELGEVRRRINTLAETLNTASDQDKRTDVRAPIDGVVKTLRFNTIGGVVQPGEAILDIVPKSDQLVVRAKLDPKDRGYVIEGLPARVKVSTFDYARYGDLDGKVELIAASTDMTQDGVPYYNVVVRTEKTYLGDEAGQYEIQPGMQATVDIHTGKRTVMDFLIRPVLKLRHEAFRER